MQLIIRDLIYRSPLNFVFGTMVKNVSDMQDDYWYYGTELIPHLFTIIIIIWFVVFQIRKIINMK